MKNPGIFLLCFVVGIAVGWALGGLRPGPVDPEAHGMSSTRSSSRAVHVPRENANSLAWPGDTTAVDLAELEGLHAIGAGSPALELSQWIGPRPNSLGLFMLARWLELPEDRQQQLAEILTDIAAKQIEWERRNVPRTELEANHVRLEWKPMPTELRDEIRARLREVFGEEMAGKVWLKGNLDRFAHPQERIESPDATIELALEGNPSTGKLKLGIMDVERENATYFWIPSDLAAVTSNESVPLRFAHFFDWDEAVAKLAREAPEVEVQAGYPHAQALPGQAGFVTSPHSGTPIDVRGIPAGTLVADPTFPADEKKYFRVPDGAE